MNPVTFVSIHFKPRLSLQCSFFIEPNNTHEYAEYLKLSIRMVLWLLSLSCFSYH